MSEELLKQLLEEIKSLKQEVEELKAEKLAVENRPVYAAPRGELPTPKVKSREEILSSPEMQKAVDAVINIYKILKAQGRVR